MKLKRQPTFGSFTASCLEALHMLEAQARLNPRGNKLLNWLKARYPIRETVYADDEGMVTKIPLWPRPHPTT